MSWQRLAQKKHSDTTLQNRKTQMTSSGNLKSQIRRGETLLLPIPPPPLSLSLYINIFTRLCWSARPMLGSQSSSSLLGGAQIFVGIKNSKSFFFQDAFSSRLRRGNWRERTSDCVCVCVTMCRWVGVWRVDEAAKRQWRIEKQGTNYWPLRARVANLTKCGDDALFLHKDMHMLLIEPTDTLGCF